VAIPVVLGFPAMLFSIPPLMVLIPATLPLGVQIAPAIFCFSAVVPMSTDSLVESRFGVFYCVLALGSVIGVRNWYCNEP
jgi:hypothetical protein